MGAALAWAGYRYLHRARRNLLQHRPLAAAHIAILERNLPLYTRLPADVRARLHGCINLFLADKNFIGCEGLAVTEEMRLTIAGNACLLLAGRGGPCYPGFSSILVYPDTYVAEETHYDGLVQTTEASTRVGESWQRGPVVLSWADVLRGIRGHEDGYNVVMHEFAHKLDEENDIMDGLPVLRDSSQYAEWARVLSREYASLQHRPSPLLDDYGAESPAEFFAVATETFFEKPAQMQRLLPELYQQLNSYYNLDPAKW